MTQRQFFNGNFTDETVGSHHYLEDGVDEKSVLAVNSKAGLQHLLLRGPVVHQVSVDLDIKIRINYYLS